jgi:arabinose-5-phosphate isomerase
MSVAARTVRHEINGLIALEASLAHSHGFSRAIGLLRIAARVIVTGMGKSGYVAQKVAATMSSTGTPAYYIHPAEAGHGDLGMITKDDAVLAFSWSGETIELGPIVDYAKRFRVPLVAVTSDHASTLGKAADIVVELPDAEEACPFGMAPTTSTIMQMAVGDALAMELIEAHGFTRIDYKVLHPGGKLGAKLKFVSDLMHQGDAMPLVYGDTIMAEVLVTMTQKAMGCAGVMDGDNLIGIVTDGDLRRHLRNSDLLRAPARQVMTISPKTIPPDMLASAALEIMNAKEITALFVCQGAWPVGIIHVHDLLRVGVV